MTETTSPGDGDSELAAPLDDGEGESVRTTPRTRPSNTVLLLGAILVIVIAQLAMTFLVLSSTNQVRDQYTAANGLQRCLIHAQLNENQSTDPSGTAYKAAVNTCLK
jgi:hypothetical protein